MALVTEITRYFLVSFVYNVIDQSIHGHLSFHIEGFPNYQALTVLINKGDIVITNIFEFEDQQDYQTFENKDYVYRIFNDTRIVLANEVK